MLQIDKRLKSISEKIPHCGTVADIGTDHGKLGCYLLERNICEKLWFSDISAPSLEKARLLAGERGLNARSEFYISDGAKDLPGAPDCAVIAGMGGRTIADIIAGSDKLNNCTMVLAPNSHIFELREFLQKSGFEIYDESVARDASRYYIIICVRPGNVEYSFKELLAGPKLIDSRSEEMRSYVRHRLNIANSALEGQNKSENADTTRLEAEIEVWKALI